MRNNFLDLHFLGLTNPTKIADTFNDDFSSIADNLLNERKYHRNISFRDYLANPLANSFMIHLCKEHEVKDLINQLKLRKSLGPNTRFIL